MGWMARDLKNYVASAVVIPRTMTRAKSECLQAPAAFRTIENADEAADT
jgi:hypothetical protein